MNEYQIVDLINGINSNVIAAEAIFITTLSAYLVVAYSVGKALTTYQVSFINLVFLLMMYVGFTGQSALVASAYNYAEQLDALKPDLDRIDANAEAVRYVIAAIRVVLAAGALMFMWQVRHTRDG